MFKLTQNIKIGLGLLLVGLLIALIVPGTVTSLTKMATISSNSLGLVCTEDAGTTPTFDLETKTGYITAPDGNSIFMWGYTVDGNPFQMPGPILCVNEGDTVTVNLTNNLPEPSSIIFPGQADVSTSGGAAGLLTAEAAASGGTVSYSFVAGSAGTYLYESGSNQHKQVHMGLYGAIVVRPSLGANFAYNDTTTEFDPAKEYILILHEIDPDLHRRVERGRSFLVNRRHDRYWTINGRSSPDTLSANFAPWLTSQPYGAVVQVEAIDPDLNPNGLPALIRYVNAGTVNHPFHPHGDHLDVIAQDGRLLGTNRLEQFTKTIAAGQTIDLLFTWTNVEQWTPGSNGPIPVALPSLQNLVFKDDVTFYSGDPDLGETGPLPPGTTSFNQCGEYYFPWHSHALHEIQNFDEGFGGMLTVVRVDKPGGC
jgi:FtsP/CotA-like multicopper oxidase with cupredoxin domain